MSLGSDNFLHRVWRIFMVIISIKIHADRFYRIFKWILNWVHLQFHAWVIRPEQRMTILAAVVNFAWGNWKNDRFLIATQNAREFRISGRTVSIKIRERELRRPILTLSQIDSQNNQLVLLVCKVLSILINSLEWKLNSSISIGTIQCVHLSLFFPLIFLQRKLTNCTEKTCEFLICRILRRNFPWGHPSFLACRCKQVVLSGPQVKVRKG